MAPRLASRGAIYSKTLTAVRNRRNEPIRTWQAGDIVQGFALLTKKELRQDRNGKDFLDLELARRQRLASPAKVWSDSPALRGAFEAHRFVAFRGTGRELQRGRCSSTSTQCREATEDDRNYGFDESKLIPSTRDDIDDLWRRLERLYPDASRPRAPAPPGRGDPGSSTARRCASTRPRSPCTTPTAADCSSTWCRWPSWRR